ncbi:hypothetical protein CC78DRAFT_90982 [Lojkania enalia]|uniref:Uncharacterized protein n=1 Tax=Lojkania enalia TaxID=147567 RepID=A0A9P4N4Y5_9PLEO|nr:hypothetical protein CC78DRAFT_90982 [Didymosphaeria enalia]
MPAEPPISPPTVDTTASENAPATANETANEMDNPISPVHRSSSFPHKTSSAAPVHAFIETSTPAINDVAVEIDGIERRAGANSTGNGVVSPGLGEAEDVDEEFLGEGKGAGRAVREKRAAMLANRSKDPAVLVDLPQEPTAEEVEAAKAMEGTVTPAVPAREFEGAEDGKR